jgi:hypothetical protein
MSQRSVERVVGKLVTDEAFRHRFAQDREAALREATASEGLELNTCERHAIAALDVEVLERLAQAIDPRLQKAEIGEGCCFKTDNDGKTEGGGIH